MSDDEIKKIANLTIRKGRINKTIAKFALRRLSRKYLLKYLMYLRRTAFENSVRIVSSRELPSALKKELDRKFSGKNVFYEIDSTLGDGIKSIIGDTVIDLSLENYLRNTVKGLKN